MRKDHRPYYVRRAYDHIQTAYRRHFLEPQFDRVGPHFNATLPWLIKVIGKGIEVGTSVHLSPAKGWPIVLTSWDHGDSHGRISIGDYAFVAPAVRISSAASIEIGANTMLASKVYLTDSDWHGVYDRSLNGARPAPIVLGDNVWLGDSVIVCKGVSIGENTVVGAGAVVAGDLPPNVVAAGVPARPVKDLDPDKGFLKREDIYADPDGLDREMQNLHRLILRENSLLGWARARMFPSKTD